tara:strand:- start:11 stop:289 length:279 start_codon:yes stop_codon:yes gene_type:complete
MTVKVENETEKSNVIPFKTFFDKQKSKTITSTIAAIIAIKIDHPDNCEPEDYFIENIENNLGIEVLAFEDAIESLSENFSSNKSSTNFINDA